MPRWRLHSKAFTQLARRYRFNSAFSELLDGLIPVVQVDKVWARDRSIYGLFSQMQTDNLIPGYNPLTDILGVALIPVGVQAHVHRIEFSIAATGLSTHSDAFGQGVHLLTPRQGYNPFDVNIDGAWFSWCSSLQAPQDQTAQRPLTFAVSGRASAHQTVSIGGAPAITTFGPTQNTTQMVTEPIVSIYPVATPTNVWEFQDPPLIVQDTQYLLLQMTGLGYPNPLALNVNWYFTEHLDQGRE